MYTQSEEGMTSDDPACNHDEENDDDYDAGRESIVNM